MNEQEYRDYLEKQRYSRTTIENYIEGARDFVKWCKTASTSPEVIDYPKLLKYVKHLQKGDVQKKTVKHRIGKLKPFFRYLVSEFYRLDNPMEDIQIKGVKRVIHYHILDSDELEDLYYSFETDNIKDPYHKLTAKRNKVIVGLMVYQGLNTTELIQLELEDLQLYKGKIYIKSGKRSNARELELRPWQLMELMEYINEVRVKILERKPLESKRLFVPNNKRLSNTIYHIIRKLRRTNAKVLNIHQVRASVITGWLGQYNLRKVQYLAGHRYISSTERYLEDDLESLHEIVNSLHPIQ